MNKKLEVLDLGLTLEKEEQLEVRGGVATNYGVCTNQGCTNSNSECGDDINYSCTNDLTGCGPVVAGPG
jgi:hypothetical protein